MQTSKIFLVGTTGILAIAGAFASKAKINHHITPWSCTYGICDSSHNALTATTVSTGRRTLTVGGSISSSGVRAHTCLTVYAVCGHTLYTNAD